METQVKQPVQEQQVQQQVQQQVKQQEAKQQEVKQQDYINDLSKETAGKIQNTLQVDASKQSSAELDSQVQKISRQVSDFLSQLPDKIGSSVLSVLNY